MTEFRQAKWSEPTLFEIGHPHRHGCSLPKLDEKVRSIVGDVGRLIPKNLFRSNYPNLPELSEVEIIKHFTRLSQVSFGVDLGSYPLGSCTMKYSPKMNEVVANLDSVHWIHPDQDESTVQGALEIMYKLSAWLAEITGTYSVSLQPSAGAHAEFSGALIIRAFHKHNGELDKRDEIIIPDSAHGTNPASAAMGGFKVIVVPSGEDGCMDLEALKYATSSRTAGLMLTNPNTLGIFEKEIIEISKIVHESGGLLYYDGANLNAILGKVRPGDMGFDVVHINLHKTFSTPHGGGGPGSGPIGVNEQLDKFLPVPQVGFDGKRYYLDYNRPYSIGKVRAFFGNFEVFVRAFSYILSLGAEGLEKVAELSVLNSNYLARKISKIEGFDLPYAAENPRKHEFAISCSKLKSKTNVEAKDVAKRLLDYGVHSPTVYFPHIVEESLMIEPTETASIEELDRMAEIFNLISEESRTNPKKVFEAPHNTSVTRLDEVRASHPRTLCLNHKMMKDDL